MLTKIGRHKKAVVVISVLAVIAVILAFALKLLGNNIGEMAGPNQELQQAFRLEKQDLSTSIACVGTVESANVIEVTSEVSSQVTQLNVSLGDHVEKGDVLCLLDDTAIRRQIQELENRKAAAKAEENAARQKAKSALDQAETQLNAASQTQANIQALYDKVMRGEVAGDAETVAEQLIAAQAEYASCMQAVSDAREALNSVAAVQTGEDTELSALYEQLNQLTITADQSGIITQLNVSKGSAASGTLMRIEDDKNLKVNVSIKEKDIMKLSEGLRAVIRSDAVGEDQNFEGTVYRVINFASPGSSSDGTPVSGYSATVALEPGVPLLLGMTVKVEIILNEAAEQLAVPYDAIAQDESGKDYIYKASEGKDGKYLTERVYVTTGIANEYYTEILTDELQEGDLILNYPEDVTEGERIELYLPEEQML